VNQFSKRDAQRIVERPVDARLHDVFGVLESRPVNGPVLDEFYLELHFH